MTAELISVGAEILMGNIVNTNAAYLSRKCAGLGLSLYYETVVGDNEERLLEVINTAWQRAEVVILSGGLGPTEDDLTKETAAKALGRSLYLDEHSRQRIIDIFNDREIHTITENNWKQAMVPTDSIVVDNKNGTAPGIIMEEGEKCLILLPGPPGELIPMFENDIYPYLRDKQPEVLCSAMVKICGMGESRVETEILDLIDGQTNPTIAPYAKEGEVHLRVTAKADSEEDAMALIRPVVDELFNRFGKLIYTTREEMTLEAVILDILKERGLKLATVESCTGGLLSARLIDVPGASAVFTHGFITYSNEAKQQLVEVPDEILKQYGAVSPQTAKAMAEGAAKVSGAEAALSVTGIAGPDGGSEEKPVGLVYIGCCINGNTRVREYRFKGNRTKIRSYSVVNALIFLRELLLEGSN